MRLAFSIIVIFLLLSGCTSTETQQSYEDIYADREKCNGDMDISHSVTISTSDKGQVKQPKVKAVCQPKVYDPQTEFEKENRRGHNEL